MTIYKILRYSIYGFFIALFSGAISFLFGIEKQDNYTTVSPLVPGVTPVSADYVPGDSSGGDGDAGGGDCGAGDGCAG